MEQHIETRGVHQRSVVGVFDHATDAERALEQLRELGIGGGEVSLMMRDSAVEEPHRDTGASPVSSGAASGAAVGGLLGGLAGWMIAIGAIGIPGIGTVVGAGALAAMLTGVAIGAAAGGLVGALLGIGVPEEEAKVYEGHVRAGRILVTIHPSSSMDAAGTQQLLQSNGAYDVRVYEAPPAHAHSVAAPVYEAQDAGEPVVETSAASQSLGSGAEGGYGEGQVPTSEEYAPQLARDQDLAEEMPAAEASNPVNEAPAGDDPESAVDERPASESER